MNVERNANAPRFDKNNYFVRIHEVISLGEVFLNVSATDADVSFLVAIVRFILSIVSKLFYHVVPCAMSYN